MKQQKSLEIPLLFFLFSRLPAMLVICMGVFVIIGWQFDIEELKRIFFGLVTMNPLTAVCFIMGGVALYLQTTTLESFALRIINGLFPLLIIIFSAIKLLSIVYGFDAGIDSFMFSEKLLQTEINYPNRMAPNTALCFLLSGVALVLNTKYYKTAQIFSLLFFLLAFLALVGYFYKVGNLYGFSLFIPMALNTAISFILLAVGSLSINWDKGFMNTITNDTPGGVLVRKLLPIIFIVPIILGLLRIYGEDKNIYPSEMGVALHVITTIALFITIVWIIARELITVELKKRQEEKKRYELLLENMLEGAQIIGYDWTYKYINQSLLKQSTYSNKEELIGHTMMEKYPGIENSELFKVLKDSMENRTYHLFEHEFDFPDGSKGCFELSITPIVEGVLILSVDITERKQAELDALENEKRYRSLVEANPDAIFRIDKDGNYIDFHAQEGQLILPKERFIGTNISQNLLQEDVKKLKNIIGEVIKSGKVQTFSHSYEHGGKTYYFEIRVSKSGKNEVLKVVRNITDRRLSELAVEQATKELEKTEARFRELVHNSSEITCVIDIDGKIIYMSPSVENAVGYKPEDVVGKSIFDFVHPDDAREMMEEASGKKYSLENKKHIKAFDDSHLIRRVKHKYYDGWLYFRMLTSDQTHNPNVGGIIINAQNVTDLMVAQKNITNAYQLISKEKTQALNYQSRLLSSQLNPHFLFNALNSVQYYILNEEVEPALDYVSDFSKLIRSTLKNSLNDYINLAKEKQFLTDYLKLEQRRFRDKFDFTIEIDENIDEQECFLPPMLLQPYVENTIIHGIANKPTKGKVKITFSAEESDILCTIDDDGVGREDAIKLRIMTKGKNHVSISTDLTALRLDVLNKVSKGKYSSKIIDKKTKSGKSKGTCVEIRFPKISLMED